jgi:AraC family transcriptional regulator
MLTTADMPIKLDDVTFGQGRGDKPDVLLAGRSAGEYGIGVARLRFAGGAFAKGSAPYHLLMFNLGPPARISCRVNNKSLEHVAPRGNITVCPAGSEFSGKSSESLNILLFAIPREPLACFCAEHAKPKSALLERLSGWDGYLLGAARDLIDEAANGFSGGPRYWAELTDALFCRLFEDYLFVEPDAGRGVLTPEALARINAYVTEHLGDPIDVDTIADVAAKGRSQFPRIFRRSVGLSPYQYLVRLRLKHALQMMGLGEMTLAEVAAATGFVDQSHLCRWMKRVYGTSPAQFASAAHPPG